MGIRNCDSPGTTIENNRDTRHDLCSHPSQRRFLPQGGCTNAQHPNSALAYREFRTPGFAYANLFSRVFDELVSGLSVSLEIQLGIETRPLHRLVAGSSKRPVCIDEKVDQLGARGDVAQPVPDADSLRNPRRLFEPR